MAKRGRPSKYEGQKTIEKIEKVIALLRTQPEQFLSACGIEQLADALEVCIDTIYEWQKVHPEFSEVIKRWVTARNATLYKLAKTLPPAIWIFMTKNMLGWQDKQEMKYSGDIKASGKLTIEVVNTKVE